jgi:hypothetical protein
MASLNAFPLGTVAVTPETLAACAALSAVPTIKTGRPAATH